jgi:hypothetical protein
MLSTHKQKYTKPRLYELLSRRNVLNAPISTQFKPTSIEKSGTPQIWPLIRSTRIFTVILVFEVHWKIYFNPFQSMCALKCTSYLI